MSRVGFLWFGFLAIGLGMAVCFLSGCQQTAKSSVPLSPPVELAHQTTPQEALEPLPTPNSGIRKFYSTVERLKIRHATIHVPD